VSDKLPTKEQTLQLLVKNGCQPNVIKHCEAVSKLAVEIALTIRKRGLNCNIELVEVGSLLHDIGRAKTHSVHHAIEGARIAETQRLPKPVISIIKRHVGGGISANEARRLRWPRDNYIPQTLEEKVVCYADKLIENSQRVTFSKTLENLSETLPPSSVKRLEKLHAEMVALTGDS